MAASSIAVLAATVGTHARVVEIVSSRVVSALTALNGTAPVRNQVGDIHLFGVSGPVTAIDRTSAVVGPDTGLAAIITMGANRLVAEADEIGLSQLCWAEADGVVVVSDSALVVAAAVGAEVDDQAVGVLSLMGFLIGGRSLFRGVRRLRARERLEFSTRDGLRPVSTVLPASPSPVPSASADDPTGATRLNAVVAQLLEAYPDPVLELSGGLDSRAILAAVPQSARRGMRAVTLGREADPDVVVARRLASACQLDWTRIDLSDLAHGTPSELMAMAMAAAWRRDASTNAIAALMLDEAETRLPSGPRFTGANGEFARGFYYPGVLTDGHVTPRRVAQLARWRLFTNDGTASAALVPALVERARAITLADVEAKLSGSESWRRSLDEFYLTTRMANWAGPGYSTRPSRSVALAPFFHPQFLDWSRSLPPRAGPRREAFARMVHELAPELAALPLDSGGSVTDLTRRSIARELRRGLDFGVKGAKKVDQRLRRRPKPPAADAGLVRRLQQGWSVEHTEALEDVGVFRPQVLAALASAEPVDQMTLSLAINVVAAQRFLGTVRADVSVPTESSSPPIP